MSGGFKVTAPPAPPRVLAAEGEPECGESHPEHGTYCERPEGHAGGHRSESHNKYWQREEAMA